MKFAALLLCASLAFTQTPSVEVAEASIADLQKALTAGRITSRALVQLYLDRIAAFDQRGPALNSLITINANALEEAAALDRERQQKGPRGPLHGIPIIVKDNYSTKDMQTTAGTLALIGFTPNADATQVRKLKEAGAIILAKSNLHELASGITTVGSAFGQTRNPYDPTRHPGGSSGGTGAAVAASFAAAGMGSDTCGSIRIPAAVNNLVGLRPTKGLSSIAGIVPLSVTQDTGGPLARSVADLATVLDATIGEDPADPATLLGPAKSRPNFTQALVTASLKDVRIGVLEPLFGDSTDDPQVIRLVRAAVEELKKQGAIPVPVPLPELTAALDGASVIASEFKEDLAQYLAAYGPAPVHSLEEMVKSGLSHADLEATFNLRINGKGRDSHDYKIALAKRTAMQETILRLLEDQKLDALVYPTLRRKPVKIGDAQAGSTCQLSAVTGFPAVTVPAGFTPDGLPVGVELFGRPLDDAKLLAYAYSYEQATRFRRAPARTPALQGKTALPLLSWQAKLISTSGNVSGSFSLNPATSELTYKLAASNFAPGELLALTLHRQGKERSGPIVQVLSNRSFSTLEGALTLSDPDRAALLSGGLYLRFGIRSQPVAGLRLVLEPSGPNNQSR